jgi:hypothetical protein
LKRGPVFSTKVSAKREHIKSSGCAFANSGKHKPWPAKRLSICLSNEEEDGETARLEVRGALSAGWIMADL